jgi:hypothetical protein
MDGKPDRVATLLASAFTEELNAAKSDLQVVPWISGIPRPEWQKRAVRVRMLSRFPPRNRRFVLQAGAVALVVVLASAGVLVPTLLRHGATAVPPGTGSSQATATGSPSVAPDPTRYDDGIPRMWQGQPVLRGQAALDAANAATDESPFLVAFWAGIEVPHGCVAQPPGGNSDFGCGYMDNVGDQPGVTRSDLEHALRVDTSKVAPGPVIARVHTHDPALEGCTPDVVAACRAIMVGDAIVWSGDEPTVPRPSTAAQVAAAFGVPSQPVVRPICPGASLPGVPIMEFPSENQPEGVIAIFPSAESLAAVAPEAAGSGESDIAPAGRNVDCNNGGGTDSLRGPGIFAFRIRWLARGNVLVGVQYDASLGPDHDRFVGEARTKLQSLPVT